MSEPGASLPGRMDEKGRSGREGGRRVRRPPSRHHVFDIRAVVRWLYPDDPVTRLLCAEPIPLTWGRLRMFAAMIRASIYDERIRFWFTPRRPNGVAIEITNSCNLRCKMCNLIEMQRPPKFMSMDIYRKIIDRCAEQKVGSVRLHTYGETLLHPNLPEMLTYAKTKGFPVWISTNAQLLDEDTGRKILQAGVDVVRYSVEGTSKDVYEKVRVRGKWETLTENIATFQRLRDELSPNTNIGLNTVLMKDTIDGLGDVASIFGPYVDQIEISALEALGRAGQKVAAGQWLEEVDLGDRIPCRLLWDMMNIAVDGSATLCCADLEAEVKVGSAIDEDLGSIWRGRALSAERKEQKTKGFAQDSICRECTFGVTNTARNRLRYALLSDRVSHNKHRPYGGKVQ
jgi:pyruvate-formate lyase-activating enzyme